MRICRTTRSCTASRQGLWGLADGRGGQGRLVGNAVLVKQSQRAVQPLPIPPLPPETVTLARPSQMVPNLLFHPVADIREAATRVTKRKVLHPAPQDGIDTCNHLCDRPRPMAPKDLFERLQQRRPLLAARRA